MKGSKMIVLLTLCCGTGMSIAQRGSANTQPTARRTFTFRAQYIQPMRGPQTLLTGIDYTVAVTPDSVVCYLPYRGVAYNAPVNLRDAGLKLTSKNFNYTSIPKKNGSEEVIIEPKDNQQVQRFRFSLMRGRSAYLTVTLRRAEPVSFAGELE